MIYVSFSKRTPRVSLRKKKTPFEHHFWLELWSSAFETWSLCNLILILALFSCVRDEAFGCLGFQCVDGSCMGQQGAFSDAAVLPETLCYFGHRAAGPQTSLLCNFATGCLVAAGASPLTHRRGSLLILCTEPPRYAQRVWNVYIEECALVDAMQSSTLHDLISLDCGQAEILSLSLVLLPNFGSQLRVSKSL